MRTKAFLTLAVVAMVLVGSAAIASNMGFKISIPLTAAQSKYVSIPFYNSYTDAASLRNDVIAAGGGAVTVYDWTGTAWQRYAGGGIGQVNFAMTSGKGYQVAVSTGVAGWIVVGSHNPSLAISIPAAQTRYVSVPYHTTSTTAAFLRNELIGAGGGAVTVYDWTGTAWQRYAGGGIGQVNFNLTAGKAVQAACSTTATWTPAHY